MSKLNEHIVNLTQNVKYLREENRCLREKLYQALEISQEMQVEEAVYEPQTYDEAVALCRGWKRCVDESYFICWKTPKGVWPPTTYSNVVPFSWEKDKWPGLWKEMLKEGCLRKLYLSEISDEWVFNLSSVIYTDSTPGRVVCQVYLIYKGHPDWAERLSKHEELC